MFNSSTEVTEYINRDVNIVSCSVALEKDRYIVSLYTNWFGCLETIENNDLMEEKLNDLLNRIDSLVKLNNYMASKISLLSVTFVYSNVDFITMESYNKINIHISPESINRLPLDDLEAEMMANNLLDSLNIVELLNFIDSQNILGKHKDVYEVLNKGMNTLNDVINAVKGKSKGKLSTVILLIIRDLAVLTLLNIDISLDNRNIAVSVFDDKVLSLDTGAVLNNNDVGSVIADRVRTHISNSI